MKSSNLFVLIVIVGLLGCNGDDAIHVVLDPDYHVLRDDLPPPGSGQALTITPGSWGRTGWVADSWARDSRWLPAGLKAYADADSYRTVSVDVSFELDPDQAELKNGLAIVDLEVLGVAGSQTQETVHFWLHSDAQPQVSVVSGSLANSSYDQERALLSVSPEMPLSAGDIWQLSIGWQDSQIEQTIDLFPEGGGSVVANAVGEHSSYFTYGYHFWPRLQGQVRFDDLRFTITHPAGSELIMSGHPDGGPEVVGTKLKVHWRVDFPTDGVLALALGEYPQPVEADCGATTVQIFALPGKSIDNFPIDPDAYESVLGDLCAHFSERFGPPAFETIRFVGVDEKFTNGFSAPTMVVVPNYVFDDDGTGSFAERDFYLAHELSHQWWGNDVFLGSARDAWLIEGMADYAAASLLARMRATGEQEYDWIWLWEVQDLLDHYREGGVDHPLVPDADSSVQMAPQIYYIKGAWVFRMLEKWLGRETCDGLIRAFREQHPFTRATTEAFLLQALATAGQDNDLDSFFDQWLFGTGLPSLQVEYTTQADTVTGTVSQSTPFSVGDQDYFYLPDLLIRADRDGRVAQKSLSLLGQSTGFTLSLP